MRRAWFNGLHARGGGEDREDVQPGVPAGGASQDRTHPGSVKRLAVRHVQEFALRSCVRLPSGTKELMGYLSSGDTQTKTSRSKQAGATGAALGYYDKQRLRV